MMFDHRFGPINQIVAWLFGKEMTLLWTINPMLVYPSIIVAEVWQWRSISTLVAEPQAFEEADRAPHNLVRLVLVHLEREGREVLHARHDVAPVHVPVAWRTVVADTADVMQVRPDAARGVVIQPCAAVNKAEAVEHFPVAHVVPVASLFERETFEELVVFEWVRDFVEVVPVLYADGDSGRLCCPHKFQERSARGHECRLSALRPLRPSGLA